MNRKEKLWTRNFALITIINLLLYLSFQMFPSSMPEYVKSLGAPESVLGWVTGITTIATLLVRPLSGMILDRYGRKGIFLLGMAVMLVTTGAYFIFPYVGVVLLLRFIHGIGWGIATTASNTIASDNIVASRFGEGMGYFSLSISLALAIAPAISISMEIHNTFLVSLGFLLVSTLLLLFLPIPPVEPTPVRKGEGRPALYERSSALPTVLIFLITTTYGGIATFLSAFGKDQGIGGVGLFFTVYALGMLLTRPVLGTALDRFGYAVLIWPSLALVSLGLVLLSQTTGLGLLVLSAVCYGVGYGSLQTCLQTMAVSSAGKGRIGAANATYYTGFDGGIGFGSVLSGLLVTAFGYGGMYLALAAFPLLAAAIFFFFGNRPQDEKQLV